MGGVQREGRADRRCAGVAAGGQRAGTQGYHYLRCNDYNSHARTAKPAGVAMVQIFVAYGPEPVPDPKEARLLNVYTTTRVKLPLRRKHDGQVATYFARWASPTGKAGPFSRPQSLRVAA